MCFDDQGHRNGYLARAHAAAWRQQGWDDAGIQQLVGIVVRTGNPGNSFNIRVKVVGRFTPALLAQYNAAPGAAAPAPVAPPAPVFGPILNQSAQLQHALQALDQTRTLLRMQAERLAAWDGMADSILGSGKRKRTE